MKTVWLGFLLVLLWVPASVFALSRSVPESVPEAARHVEAALQRPDPLAAEAGALPNGFSATDTLRWFYAERGYAPAWDRENRLARLIAALEALVEDGLDPESYRLADLRQMQAAQSILSPAQIACKDLLATDAYLAAVLHLALGRLDPSEIEPTWRPGEPAVADAARLRLIMLATESLDAPGLAFAQARPDTVQYRGLRAAHVALLRQPAETAGPTLPSGSLLREGDRDPRVPLLRQRLQVEAPEDAAASRDSQRYDADLVAAVLDFQRDHGLAADGIVGPETLAALNRSVASRLEQLRVNLERMRWLASDPLDFGVLVDIAGAQIRYVREGETVWSARAQVGRPTRQTPRLQSEVTHLTFNPSWTVPPTIFRQDVLPQIRHDIGYLKENRMQVLDHGGNRLDPAAIDWSDPSGILVRQEPGPHNALGRVAFRFPNPFHVYLHDTPNQMIFERAHRQVSSGCVRVERPMELVDLLAEDGSEVDREHVAELQAAGGTRNFHLPRPIPIRIAYWTADVAADGSVSLRPDIYGRDPRIAQALSEPVLASRRVGFCAGLDGPY